MKLKFQGKALATAAKWVQNALGQSPRPALTCVLLEAKEGEPVTLSSTNLQNTCRMRIPDENVTVKKHGAALIDGARFTKLAIRDPELSVSIGKTAEIRTSAGRFRLQTLAITEYPELPEWTKGGVKLEAGVLTDLFSVGFAAGGSGRCQIDCVRLKIGKKKAEAAGTDVRALAVYDMGGSFGEEFGPVLIPLSALSPLSQMDDVRLIEDSRVIAISEDRLFAFLPWDGTYPPFRDMIPADSGNTAEINKEELKRALEGAILVLDGDSRAATFSFSKDSLEIRAAGSGEFDAAVDCSYGGEAMEIAFNVGFVLRAFPYLAETVHISLTEQDKPAVFKNAGFTYVLACVRRVQ